MSAKNTKKKSVAKKPESSNGLKEANDQEESTAPSNKSKHIVFESDDEDNVVSTPAAKPAPPSKTKGQKSREDALEIGTAWYQTVSTQKLNSN